MPGIQARKNKKKKYLGFILKYLNNHTYISARDLTYAFCEVQDLRCYHKCQNMKQEPDIKKIRYIFTGYINLLHRYKVIERISRKNWKTSYETTILVRELLNGKKVEFLKYRKNNMENCDLNAILDRIDKNIYHISFLEVGPDYNPVDTTDFKKLWNEPIVRVCDVEPEPKERWNK